MQIAVTCEEIDSFMCSTLLGVQQQLLSKEKSLSEIIKDGLENLIEKGLVKGRIPEKDHNSKCILTITPLGKATYKGKTFFIFTIIFISANPFISALSQFDIFPHFHSETAMKNKL